MSRSAFGETGRDGHFVQDRRSEEGALSFLAVEGAKFQKRNLPNGCPTAFRRFGKRLLAARLQSRQRVRQGMQSLYGLVQDTSEEPYKLRQRFSREERADSEKYPRLEATKSGTDQGFRWRSGIKHDCSKVMELTKEEGAFRNGFGETVTLESAHVYPLLKSSDLAGDRYACPTRAMIVPQRRLGEDTSEIRRTAPRTWDYLTKYGDLLDKRSSVIYSNRPRFSVFGVGAYSFTPWKVAISGFYKKISFKAVGSLAGKPVVFDDTCYFIPCRTKRASRTLVNAPEFPFSQGMLRFSNLLGLETADYPGGAQTIELLQTS